MPPIATYHGGEWVDECVSEWISECGGEWISEYVGEWISEYVGVCREETRAAPSIAEEPQSPPRGTGRNAPNPPATSHESPWSRSE
jgi:hypothetical protein